VITYIRDMGFHFRRGRAELLLVPAVLLLAACSSTHAGSATPAFGTSAVATTVSTPVATASVTVPSTRASPTAESTRSSSVHPATDIASGAWSFAHIEFGSEGIPSPTGDLTAQPAGNRVCFQPGSRCAELADQDRPAFAVYSPDGKQLLIAAGPDGSADRSIYVLDTDDASVRVIGPDGVADASTGEPPRWDLSSVAWSVDGSSVVIVPHTEADTGAVLSADLATGAVTGIVRLPADLANASPSIWPTRNGIALIVNSGQDRQTLWWQYPGDTAPADIARFQQDGGSLHLSAADPLGRVVLTCPRTADGRLGATIAVGVDSRRANPALNDSVSCAGAVFSADGRFAALTAQLAGTYSLVIMEVLTNRRVLTVPLPVPEPSQPPFLTWFDDVVVAADVSGEWSAPSLIMRLGP